MTLPATSAVAAHWDMQKGQVMSSPMACRAPVPTTSSLTSPSPAGSLNQANGERKIAVTESFVMSRLRCWVASP